MTNSAKGVYQTLRKAALTEMDAMLGLLDLDLFNVPSRDSETTAVTVHVVQVLCK